MIYLEIGRCSQKIIEDFIVYSLLIYLDSSDNYPKSNWQENNNSLIINEYRRAYLVLKLRREIWI